MMAGERTMQPDLTAGDIAPPRVPAFDAVEFAGLMEMIGQDGVMEMVCIFESETRLRLRRLAARDQDFATVAREMHTLRGAASTVGSPRLACLGRRLEQGARRGMMPTSDQLRTIEAALEAFLLAVRARETTSPGAA